MTNDTVEICDEESIPTHEIINRYNVLKAIEDGIRPDPEHMTSELADQIIEVHKQLHPDGGKAIPQKVAPELHQTYQNLLNPWLYGRPVIEARSQDHTPERRKDRIIVITLYRRDLQDLHDHHSHSADKAFDRNNWSQYRIYNSVELLCKSAIQIIDDELMIIAGTGAQKAIELLDDTSLDDVAKNALKDILAS